MRSLTLTTVLLTCLACGGVVPLDELPLSVPSPAAETEEEEEEEAPADAEGGSADIDTDVPASDISLVALAMAEELATAERQPPPFSDEPVPEVEPEELAERIDIVAAWVTDNPEVVAHRALLVDRLRAHANEEVAEAWAGLQADLEAKEPLEVDVATAPWRVIIAFAQFYDTSEDWAFFVGDVQKAVKEHAVGMGYLQWGQRELQVMRNGRPVHKVAVPAEALEPFAQGYLVIMEGKEPQLFGHAPVAELLPDMGKLLELPLSAD